MRGMRGMRGMRIVRVKRCLDEADEATAEGLFLAASKRMLPYVEGFIKGGGKVKSTSTEKHYWKWDEAKGPYWQGECHYNIDFSSFEEKEAFTKQKEKILQKFKEVMKVEARKKGYSLVSSAWCHFISLNTQTQAILGIQIASNAKRRTVKALDVDYLKSPNLTEADLNSFIQHTEKLQRMIKAYLKAVKSQVGPGAFHLIERYLVSPQIMDQSINRALPILKKYTRLLGIQSGKSNPHNIPGHRGVYRAVGMPLKSSSLLNSKKRVQNNLGLPSGVPVPSKSLANLEF